MTESGYAVMPNSITPTPNADDTRMVYTTQRPGGEGKERG